MNSKTISRRAALQKLGLGTLAAYVVPEFLAVSTAAAASGSSEPSAPSESSAPSEPSTASEPSAPEASQPSGPEDEDWRDDNTCRAHANRSNQTTMSNSDFRRAERAVRRGQARPLSEIFQSVQQRINGRLLEVRFDNRSGPAMYQFRMISPDGRLINIFSDASSGEILRIVNC